MKRFVEGENRSQGILCPELLATISFALPSSFTTAIAACAPVPLIRPPFAIFLATEDLGMPNKSS